MNRRVKTEVPDEPVPRVAEPQTLPSPVDYQEQINRLVEAVNRNTKEIQDLRMLVHTIGKNQELESASLQMRCNDLQAQVDHMMRMICNGGVPMHGFPMNHPPPGLQINGNMGQYPMPVMPVNLRPSGPSSDHGTPMEQPQMNIQEEYQNSDSSHPQSLEPDRSPSPEIEILEQNVKITSKRASVRHDSVDSSSTERAVPSPVVQVPIPVLQQQEEPTQQKMSKKTSMHHCVFCDQDKHTADTCTLYKYEAERKEVARKRNLCLKCLKYSDDVNNHWDCRNARFACRLCHSHSHFYLFCDNAMRDYKKCEFCNEQGHDTKKCPYYFKGTTASQRRLKMYSENRCFQCLKKNNKRAERKHTHCLYESHICQLCFPEHNDRENAAHHPLLCEYFHDKQKQEDSTKKTKAPRPAPY